VTWCVPACGQRALTRIHEYTGPPFAYSPPKGPTHDGVVQIPGRPQHALLTFAVLSLGGQVVASVIALCRSLLGVLEPGRTGCQTWLPEGCTLRRNRA